MTFKFCKNIFNFLVLNIILFQLSNAVQLDPVTSHRHQVSAPRLTKDARELSIIKLPHLTQQTCKKAPPPKPFSYRGHCFQEEEIPNEFEPINSTSITTLQFTNLANRNHVISLKILTIKNSDITTTRITTLISIPIGNWNSPIKLVKEITTPKIQYYRYARNRFIHTCLKDAIDIYIQEINPLDEWGTPKEIVSPQFPY